MKPLAPEPLGRLLSSDEQVLLCSDSSGDWTRVGANQMLDSAATDGVADVSRQGWADGGRYDGDVGRHARRVVGQHAARPAGRSHSVRPRGLDAAGEGRFAAARGVRRSHRHDHVRQCRSRGRLGCALHSRPGNESGDQPVAHRGRSDGCRGAILWEETPEKVMRKAGRAANRFGWRLLSG